jgi:hypothetical protein
VNKSKGWKMALLASLIALAAGAFAGSKGAPADKDKNELRRMKEDLWPRAYREGDVSLLDRILASEFQMVDADGNWSDKAAELDYVSKHKAKSRSFRFEIRRLEVFENGTAVVAGRGVVVGPESDPEGGYEYQSSNVLIKRDGRWQAIASHVSGVRPIGGSRANGR